MHIVGIWRGNECIHFTSANFLRDVAAAAVPVLERFVVLMYDRRGDCHDARQALFIQKGRSLENISTVAAPPQHTRRVASQEGHCWGQCLLAKDHILEE